MSEFLHDVPELRIWSAIDHAAEMYPDFRTVVASENRPVVNEGDFQAESCRADSCAYTRSTASGYHEIEITCVPRPPAFP